MCCAVVGIVGDKHHLATAKQEMVDTIAVGLGEGAESKEGRRSPGAQEHAVRVLSSVGETDNPKNRAPGRI